MPITKVEEKAILEMTPHNGVHYISVQIMAQHYVLKNTDYEPIKGVSLWKDHVSLKRFLATCLPGTKRYDMATVEQRKALDRLGGLCAFWKMRAAFADEQVQCAKCLYYSKGLCVIPKSRVDGGSAKAYMVRAHPEVVEAEYYIPELFRNASRVCGPDGRWFKNEEEDER